MEIVQESLPENGAGVEPGAAMPLAPPRARQSLPPKGACWYCDKPLDNVRRFCGKQCADGFDEEAGFIR